MRVVGLLKAIALVLVLCLGWSNPALAQTKATVVVSKVSGVEAAGAPAPFAEIVRREVETALSSSTLFRVPPREGGAEAILDELVRTGRRPPKAVAADFLIVPEVSEFSATQELRQAPNARDNDLVTVRGKLALAVRVLNPRTGETVSQYPVRVSYTPAATMKAASVTRGTEQFYAEKADQVILEAESQTSSALGEQVRRGNLGTGRATISGKTDDPAILAALARLAGAVIVERTLEQTNAIQVLDRQENRIWVNRGSDGGWAVGQTLRIVSKGRELRDPVSGEVLGVTTSDVGKARIVEVQPKLSVAEITSSTGDIAAGALIRRDDPASR